MSQLSSNMNVKEIFLTDREGTINFISLSWAVLVSLERELALNITLYYE